MWKICPRMTVAGGALALALGTTSCMTVLTETAKKALEDRTTEDQVTDAKIAAGITSRLVQKDKSLLLDVSADVWEQRVMLTGTLNDPSMREEVVRLVRSDQRIRTLYDEIQIVSRAEQARRRESSQSKDASKKEGIGQRSTTSGSKARSTPSSSRPEGSDQSTIAGVPSVTSWTSSVGPGARKN